MLNGHRIRLLKIPRQLELVIFIIFIFSISASVADPIFSRFVNLLEKEPLIIGILVAIASFISIAISEPAGDLCSKIGSKKVLFFGILNTIISSAIYFLTTNIVVYVIGSIILGFGTSFFWIAARTIILDITKRGARGVSFAMYDLSWSIGWAVGPLIGGFVAYSFGIRFPFLVSAIVSLLTFPLVLKFVKEPKSHVLPLRKALHQLVLDGEVIDDAKDFFKHANKEIIWLLINYVLLYSVWLIFSTYAPLLFSKLNNFELGVLFFVFSISFAVLTIPIGMLVDRYGKKIFVVSGYIFSAVFIFLLVYLNTFPLILLDTVLIGFGLALIHPALDACLGDKVKPKYTGITSGLVLALVDVGFAIGPIMGGVVSQFWGYSSAFVLGSMIMVISGCLNIFLIKEKVREVSLS